MGRQAAGVRGMSCRRTRPARDRLLVAKDESRTVLTATENGYGKRTPIAEYTRHGRGTQGMIAIQTSERNGKLVAAELVADGRRDHADHHRRRADPHRVAEIREQGRSTQGVTLINLDEGEKLAGLERIEEHAEVEGNGGEGEGGNGNGGDGELPAPESGEPSAHRPLMSRIFNFSAGPAMLPAGAGAGGRGDARLARPRHVGDGDEPSRQGVHRHRRRGRGRPARAARDPDELQGAVPAGRRDAAVRARADEPAARQEQAPTT